jgi:hypothetical protein
VIDIIKRRLSAAVAAYEWMGETVHFRRLSAASWISLQSLATPEADTDPMKGVNFYVELIAATLCNSQGVTECDTSEGRESLRQLGLKELQSLGELSLKHSGLDGESKN